ncbi:MAG TPA: hypothetical protein VF519_15735 [Mycobacteriales bacterium]|jgi:hypothetical protein
MSHRLLVAGAAAALAFPVAPPAEALDANVYVITGSGTLSPGLTVVPTPQSISFTGTASYASTFPVGLGGYSCSFSGTDQIGSVLLGLGSLSGSCGPTSGVDMVLVRVGPTLSLTTAVIASASRGLHFDCVFQPTNVNPTTRFNLACVVAVDYRVP